MDESINFIANTKEFKSVKKMKVLPEVKALDVLEFLVSVEVTTNSQITRLLGKIVNLSSFNNDISSYFSKDSDGFIKEINSSSFSKIVEKNLIGSNKGSLSEIVDILKNYSLNRYLIENKVMEEDAVGYYKILFPTRKKQLKKAVLK